MDLLRRLMLGALLLSAMPLLAADFRVATLVNEPYSILVADKVSGISVDLIREAAHRLHKSVQIDIMPWARALRECERGSADIILNVVRTPEREQFLEYVPTAVTWEEAVFIVPQHSALHFDGNLEALRGSVVGTGRGFRFGEPVDQAFASGLLRREDHNTVAIMLNILSFGRLTIGMADKTLGAYEMRKLGLAGQLKILEPPLTHVPSYFAVSKKGKAAGLAPEFDRVLKQMLKDGSYAKIRARYVAND